MLDLLLSSLIVTQLREEAEIRGFRCTHFFAKAALVQPAAEVLQEDARRQVEDGIARLSPRDQATARSFIFSKPMQGYWYAPDYFPRPQPACDQLLSPEFARYYAVLSSAAHGGFLGLGLFRDEPDLLHPFPRDDPRSVALAMATSARIVVEQAHARDEFELGGLLEDAYRDALPRAERDSL